MILRRQTSQRSVLNNPTTAIGCATLYVAAYTMPRLENHLRAGAECIQPAYLTLTTETIIHKQGAECIQPPFCYPDRNNH